MATGLTPDTVRYLMDSGKRQTEIAREYGVSRQYVHKLAKDGGHEPVVTVVTEHFPWDIQEDVTGNTIYQAMRLLGHYNLDPEGLTGSSLIKLKGVVRKLVLFGQVVDYNPAYPAVPGLTNTPGFAYLPRRDEDGDYAIRIRPGVKLTTLGEKIWKLPKDMM